MWEELQNYFKDADLANYPYHIGILGTDSQANTDDSRGEAYKAYRENWAGYPEKFFVADFPLCLDLEVAFACNLRCLMCYVHDIPGYNSITKQDTFLPLKLAQKIIDEGADHSLPSMKFTSRGESLLNKNLEKMISYAKKKNILDTMFNTNATLLTEERSKRLINSGLDQLIVSLDGASAATYNKIRVGASYDKVVRNIENFVNLRNRLGLKFPSLRVQMVCMEDTRDEIIAFVNRWKGMANRINLIRYKNHKQARTDNKGLYRAEFKKIPCRNLWQRMVIGSNGKIHLCCGDYRFQVVLGDAARDSLWEIWHGSRLTALREAHRNMVFTEPVCRECQTNIVADFWSFLEKDPELVISGSH